MKNTVARELFVPESNALSFKSLLPFEIRSALLPFYLGLDFDGRRARFGAGISDSVIAKHCANLNLDHAIVLACEAADRFVAAIELHPVAPDWKNVELALACPTTSDETAIVAHLKSLQSSY